MTRTLASLFSIELMSISPLSLFVGYGYLQHAGPKYNRSHRLWYHFFFQLSVVLLVNAIWFAYGDYLMLGSANDACWAAAEAVKTH